MGRSARACFANSFQLCPGSIQLIKKRYAVHCKDVWRIDTSGETYLAPWVLSEKPRNSEKKSKRLE